MGGDDVQSRVDKAGRVFVGCRKWSAENVWNV